MLDYEIIDNFKHKDIELYNNQIEENSFYLIPSGRGKNNMH